MTAITNPNELSIAFPQQIYYSISKPLHVDDVIQSLKGLKTLVKSTRSTLNTLLDTEINRVELYIKNIEEGSLLEETFVKLFFNTRAEYDDFLAKIHKKFGDKAMKTAGTVILAVVGSLTLYGIVKAAMAGIDNDTIAVESYNTINNYYINSPIWDKGATLINKKPEDFKKMIEQTIKNSKTVAQSALDIMSPVKNDASAELFIGEDYQNAEPTIPQDVARATPHGRIEFSSIEDVIDYNDIDIQIRALDLDNPKKGWAGIIPNIIDYRVKIEVADGVDQTKLKINKTISADVSVEMKKDNATGQLKATKVTLLKIY